MRRGLMIVVVAAALMALATNPAAADVPGATFTQPACYSMTYGGDYTQDESIFSTNDSTGFELTASCPDLAVSQWQEALDGEQMRQIATVPSNLTGLSFTLSGGPGADSGVSVYLQVCSFVECGEPVSPDPDPEAGPQAYALSVGAGIPENPVTIRLVAECATADPAGCAASTPTHFTDMMLSFADVADPVVSLTNPWGELFPGEPEWSSSPDYFLVAAGDADGYIASLTVSMGGAASATPCPLVPEQTYGTGCEAGGDGDVIVFPSEAQGLVPVSATAIDAAGRAATAEFTVLRDTVAPSAPQDLSVGTNDAGWVAGDEITATWSNPTEPTESPTESGVARAEYVLTNATGAAMQRGGDDGAGIDELKLQIGYPGEYTLRVKTFDAAGNESDESSVEFRVDLLTPVAPKLDSVPDVTVASAANGVDVTWSEWTYWDTSFSGICGYRLTINGAAHSSPVGGPDEIRLTADTFSFELNSGYIASLLDGALFVHLRSESCAGVVGAAADAQVRIDRQNPAVSASPEGGWLAPGKKLRITATDPDLANPNAGIAQIFYSVDGGSEQAAGGSTVAISPGQGMHTVKFHAADRLGNLSEERTVETGIDAVKPVAAFDAIDPSDPALVRALVSDPDSGVSDAWFEYSPPDSISWVRLAGTSVGTEPRTLSARFPDDESLPSGDYRLRVLARDNAGNTSITTVRVGGEEARLTLPLRTRPSVSLAMAAGPGRPLSNSLTVPFGDGVEARGTLRSASGAPVSGAEVAISETIPGGSKRRLAVATTGGDGAFKATIPAGPSREIEARFAGNALLGAATATATFNVRAHVTLAKLPKAVARKKRFYVTGAVDPGRAALPKLGALVALQHRDGKGWSGLVSITRTASDGTFRIRWPFRVRRGPVKFTVRAVAITETGWPYATGYSRSAKVVMR